MAAVDPLLVPDPQVIQVELNEEDENIPEIKAIKELANEIERYSSITPKVIKKMNDPKSLLVVPDLKLIIFKENKNCINILIKDSNPSQQIQIEVDNDSTVDIGSILFIPVTQLLIVSVKTYIRVYKIQTNTLNAQLMRDKDMKCFINSLCYCPSSKHLYCTLLDDPNLHILTLSNEGDLEEFNQLRALKYLDFIKVYRDTVISTDVEGGVNFWQVSNPIENVNSIEIKHHKHKIKQIELSESGIMLTNSEEHGIRVWNISPITMQGHLIGHESEVAAISITHNGLKAISGDLSYSIIIWDLNNLTELAKIPMHTGAIIKIIITKNDKHFLTCSSDHKIKIGELTTNTRAAELRGHKDAINDILISDSTIYSVSKDKTLMIWELPAQNECQKIEEAYDDEYTNVFCKDNFIIAVLDRSVHVYSNIDTENRNIGDKFVNIIENTDLISFKAIKKLQFTPDFTKLYCVYSESDEIHRANIDLNALNVTDFELIVENPNDENYFVLFETLSNNHIFTIGGSGEVGISEIVDDKNYLQLIQRLDDYIATNIECSDYKEINNIHYFAIGKESGEIDLIKVGVNNSGIANINGPIPDISFQLSVRKNIANINDLENLNKSISSILILDENHVAFVCIDDFQIYVKRVNETPDASIVPNGAQNALDDLFTLAGHRKIVKSMIKKSIRGDDFIVSVSNDLTVRAWKVNWEVVPTVVQEPRRILSIYENFALQEHTGIITSLIDLPGTNYVATGSIDTSLVLWNIIEKRIELKYLNHSSPIKGLGLLKNNFNRDVILSYSHNSIQIWDYLLEEQNKDLLIVKGASDGIDKFIALNKLKFRDELTENQRFITFGKGKFTYLHLLGYWNSHILLENALQNNFPIITTSPSKGEPCSPLYYAIKTNSMASIKLFIERINYLSQVNENTFRASCYSIRNDVNILLKSSSFAISMFFDCIFYRKELPKISNNYEKLPNIYFGESYIMSEKYFTPQTFLKNEEVVIEYRTCSIELPMVVGSKESIEFLEALDMCNINNVFRTRLISNIINYKWDYVWKYLFTHAIIFWTLLVLIAVIISGERSLTINILFVIVNTLLFFYEIIQLVTSGIEYFKDPENIFDFFTLVFNSTWIFTLTFWEEGLLFFGNLIAWAVVTLGFIRGISSFRVFDNTRFYIKLIQRAIYECSSFIVIYIYSTLAFGIMFKSSGLLDENGNEFPIFDYFWRLSYDENLGGLDSNTSTYLFYFSFFLASIINVTIMLNLLISILGDTFDNFQVGAMEVDKRKKLEGILEIEKIFSLFSRAEKRNYIHMCLQVDYDEAESEWEGKVRALDKKIDALSIKLFCQYEKNAKESTKMNNYTQDNFRNLYKKIDSMQSSLMNFISEELNKNRTLNLN